MDIDNCQYYLSYVIQNVFFLTFVVHLVPFEHWNTERDRGVLRKLDEVLAALEVRLIQLQKFAALPYPANKEQ